MPNIRWKLFQVVEAKKKKKKKKAKTRRRRRRRRIEVAARDGAAKEKTSSMRLRHG
jgi:hypothetical protein